MKIFTVIFFTVVFVVMIYMYSTVKLSSTNSNQTKTNNIASKQSQTSKNGASQQPLNQKKEPQAELTKSSSAEGLKGLLTNPYYADLEKDIDAHKVTLLEAFYRYKLRGILKYHNGDYEGAIHDLGIAIAYSPESKSELQPYIDEAEKIEHPLLYPLYTTFGCGAVGLDAIALIGLAYWLRRGFRKA